MKSRNPRQKDEYGEQSLIYGAGPNGCNNDEPRSSSFSFHICHMPHNKACHPSTITTFPLA